MVFEIVVGGKTFFLEVDHKLKVDSILLIFFCYVVKLDLTNASVISIEEFFWMRFFDVVGFFLLCC